MQQAIGFGITKWQQLRRSHPSRGQEEEKAEEGQEEAREAQEAAVRDFVAQEDLLDGPIRKDREVFDHAWRHHGEAIG